MFWLLCCIHTFYLIVISSFCVNTETFYPYSIWYITLYCSAFVLSNTISTPRVKKTPEFCVCVVKHQMQSTGQNNASINSRLKHVRFLREKQNTSKFLRNKSKKERKKERKEEEEEEEEEEETTWHMLITRYLSPTYFIRYYQVTKCDCVVICMYVCVCSPRRI